MKKKKNIAWNILIVVLVFILFFGYNIFLYINTSFFKGFYNLQGTNAYSFFEFVRTYNVAQILIFLSPLLITVAGLYDFNQIINSGFIQNMLLRKEYYKIINIEIVKSYLKGALILPISSIIIFIMGALIFGTKITITNSTNPFIYLSDMMLSNPNAYILSVIFLNFIYSIVILNIGLIITLFSHNFYITLLLTFVSVNAINFFVGNVLTFIFQFLGNENLIKIAISINYYDGYSPQSSLFIAFCTLIIYLILSIIILLFVYHKKERVVFVSE